MPDRGAGSEQNAPHSNSVTFLVPAVALIVGFTRPSSLVSARVRSCSLVSARGRLYSLVVARLRSHSLAFAHIRRAHQLPAALSLAPGAPFTPYRSHIRALLPHTT
ncbi:hypothetical protein OPQ81_011882 [Rhizoctonia solani]|nr:hypothetical protein OPQ81_002671 [Rhizoctonia solani]KAJ1300129.1 hypothetical protein OPQ81_011882 [Rhizoctonia solani]